MNKTQISANLAKFVIYVKTEYLIFIEWTWFFFRYFLLYKFCFFFFFLSVKITSLNEEKSLLWNRKGVKRVGGKHAARFIRARRQTFKEAAERKNPRAWRQRGLERSAKRGKEKKGKASRDAAGGETNCRRRDVSRREIEQEHIDRVHCAPYTATLSDTTQRHVKRRGKRKRTSNSRVTTPSFASRKFSSLNNKFNINYNPFLTFFELLTQCTFVIARLKLLVWNCLFEHECEYITIKRSEILFTLQWIKDITVIIVLIKFEINVYKSGGIFIAIYIFSKRIVWSLK